MRPHYNRFLGTRDVIGRIDVSGPDEVFLESTSRDQGLIRTPAYTQLEDCFDERCFRRLERYVVGVNWKDALDLDVEDASRLRGDSASALPELEGLAEEKRYGLNASLGWLQDATGDKFVCTTR